MNKTPITILTSLFLVFALSAMVSAWHCTDTDQAKPAANQSGLYGTWGDNGQLGGVSRFWLETGPVPAGCTGTQGDYTCTDFCDGTTLREFYCGDRVNDPWYTVILYHDYVNSTQCGYTVPEFGVVAGGIALIGAIAGIAIIRKRK